MSMQQALGPSMQVLRLTRWEWFKLRRLRMPWMLLAVAVLVSQFGIWFNYLAYHNDTVQEVMEGGTASYSMAWDDDRHVSVTMTCADVANDRMPAGFDRLTQGQRDEFLGEMDAWLATGECGDFQASTELRRSFTLPSSVTGSISGFSSLGPIAIGPLLIMILAASVVGTEYGWGTLRTVLSGGVSRWKFLFAKMLLLLRLCSDTLVVISLVAVASSLIAYLIPPDETGGLADSGRWSDFVIIFFKTLYGLLPFIALSVLATVLTFSRGLGIAASVGYFMVESIVAPLLRLSDTLASATDYLLIQSFRSWTAVPTSESSPDALHSSLVILGYTVCLIAASYWIFMRSDVGGATGD